MGGRAFSAAGLYTPRMPPSAYFKIRDELHAKLRELFVHVQTPIEGPGKKDYGDIDISVFGPRAESSLLANAQGDLLDAVASYVGAVHVKREQADAINMAMPWPVDVPAVLDGGGGSAPSADKGSLQTEGIDGRERYVQVDLHVFQSLHRLEWLVFKHAHGDLWNIFGSTIRPFGLTIDEVGLYIRIPEIEVLQRKVAKVLLTTDPTETLAFLGLDLNSDEWRGEFKSTEDLFNYATKCRLFWVRPHESDCCEDGSSAEPSKLADNATEKEQTEKPGGHITLENLKHNDRQRMKQRPMFQAWIEDFLPRCRDKGCFAACPMTREQVREDAFARFPGSRERYDEKLFEWQLQRQKIFELKRLIEEAVPPVADDDADEGEKDEPPRTNGDGMNGSNDDNRNNSSITNNSSRSHRQNQPLNRPLTVQDRGLAKKALLHIIRDGEGERYYGIPDPHYFAPAPEHSPMRLDGDSGNGDGLFVEANVSAFARARWPDALNAAKELNTRRWREGQEAKERKKREAEAETVVSGKGQVENKKETETKEQERKKGKTAHDDGNGIGNGHQVAVVAKEGR